MTNSAVATGAPVAWQRLLDLRRGLGDAGAVSHRGRDTGKLYSSGGVRKTMKESLQRAFTFLKSQVEYGIGREVDSTDFHVECVNLLGTDVDAPVDVVLFVVLYSALKKKSVKAATIIPGVWKKCAPLKAHISKTNYFTDSCFSEINFLPHPEAI